MTYPPEPPLSGPGYPPAYAGQFGPPGIARTSGKATAALITGVSSVVLSWCCGLGLAGLVAIVLGVKARREIRLSGGRLHGDGLALAGIVTGLVAVVLGVLVLALAAALVAGISVDTGPVGGMRV